MTVSDRPGKIDFTGQPESIGGDDRDALHAILHLDRAADSQVFSLPPQSPDAGCAQQVYKRFAAAIEDRDFKVIYLDVNVVDRETIERAQQMLGGLDQHALAHQAGGVTHARNVLPTGRDLEEFEIERRRRCPCRRRGVILILTGTPLWRPIPETSNGRWIVVSNRIKSMVPTSASLVS